MLIRGVIVLREKIELNPESGSWADMLADTGRGVNRERSAPGTDKELISDEEESLLSPFSRGHKE